MVAASAITILTAVGCKPGRDFRAAALPAIETGVSAILDGVLSGVFAVIEPESETTGG